MDKEALFKSRLKEKDVPIPDVGTVRVRGLNRAEVLALQGVELGVLEMERKLLSQALVDPLMSEDDVRRWQEASDPQELEPVSDAIMELSGLRPQAAKEAMLKFRDGQRAGDGVLHSGEAAHDGGTAQE